MGKPVSSRLRLASIAAAAVVVFSSFVVASPALADSNPTNPADPATPTTVTTDALPTPQIDGVVWTQKVVGNTVFVGGKFTNARPYGSAAGVNTVSRTYLLSYNLTTGVLNPGFAPVLNNQVRSIQASADGSTIYVSGAFTTVNGVTRNRVAALNATTGALVTAFNPTPNYVVNAIALKGNTLWLGGAFASVGSATRGKVAAVNATTGAVLPFTATAAGGDVTSLALSPDGSKLIVGGNFTTLNGSSNPGYGLGAVDSTSGALLPWNVNSLIRNGGTQASITALSSDADGLYGSGYVFGAGGNLEGSFRADWTNGDLIWVEDCHGDTYSIATTANAEYVAGHPHYCGNIGGFPQTSPVWTMHRGLAFSKAATQTATADPYGYYNYAGNPAPSLQNWYPEFNVGTYTGQNQGPWSVATSPDSKYVLYGGEFTTINGIQQQGLVRFAVPSIAPNKMGPQDSGANFAPSVVSLASGSARISWTSNWDPDNSTLTYAVYRDGSGTPIYTTKADSSVWNKPALGFVDTGLAPGSTHSYRVRATDPNGNTVIGDGASVTVTSTPASAYTSTVLGQGASSLWRLDETSGTNVYDWAGYNDQTAGSGVTRGAAGATGDGDRASTFSGDSNGLSATKNAVQGPQTFSVEAWFKTTTTAGGKIVGFGSSNTGLSSSYDRHLYMNPDGTVSFGIYNGNTSTISSAKALNDGTWHQIIGTLDPSAGMQFFVDGKLVGTRSDVTSAQAYSGYWRIGGDSSWNGNSYFAGSIDDVSVYPTPLTRQQVDNQWVAAGNATQIPAAPSDPYGARIYNDGAQLFYRLGDAAGSSTAKDSSINQSDGVYTGGVTAGVPGAIAGTTNTAAQFDGQSGQVDSTQSIQGPSTYSIESWFKTTTTTGGKIVGFGSSATGSSSSYDRHVYMQDNGQLVFGTYTGQLNTVTTPAAYNDGLWHQVVATQSSDGMKLYLDGILQGTDPQTQAQSYSGYWKIGGDNTWSSSSAYFQGSIDDVSIYGSALSQQTVSSHYALGTATTPNSAPTASFTSSTSDLSVALDASASSDSDGSVASYAWDFGDASTATGKTATHSYDKAGTYTVSLTVTDDKGATGTKTAQVVVTAPRVNAAPTASFTSAVTDLTVKVDGSASSDSDGTVASYAWTFGDGGTATTATASHAYTAAGTYTVKLTVTDNDGATGVSTSSVTVTAPRVNQAPTASFTATTSNLAVSVDGTASADTDGTLASYAWTFGDGSSASTPTASHSYVAAGTYTVTLRVTDNEGATGTATKSVTVAPPANVPPTASFTSSTSALRVSVDGSSSSDSDGTVAGYAWTFGDGGTATTTTASHTYAAPGTYTVTLTVTDDKGATGVSTSSVVVTKAPNAAPTASFTASASDLAVSVDGTSSSDSDGTIASYAWDFGDAGTATTAKASHTFSKAGSYSVKLTVTDNDGATASSTQVVTVTTPAANVPPTSAFTTTTSGLAITADGSTSTDSDGTVAGYAWTFGDGGTATGKTTNHTYTTAGTFTVSLTVTDDKGATNTSTRTITLTAPADAPFILDAFNRTVSNGWGNADTGGPWTPTSTASTLSVANGSGVIKLGGPGYQAGAQLTGVAQTDTDLRGTVALDKTATGGGTQVYVSGRRISSNTEYRAMIKFTSTGKMSTSLTAFAGGTGKTLGAETLLPITATGTQQVNFRMQVTGTSPTTVKVKAWLAGTTEPAPWNLTATDSTAGLQVPGGVALQGYVSASSSAGTTSVSVSQVSATRP
jgi:PKD repeat protein